MCRWFPRVRLRVVLALRLPKNLSDLRSKSGMLSLSGLGILLSITVQFVGIISWISALNVKRIRRVPLVRNVPSPGGYATMLFTSTALVVG